MRDLGVTLDSHLRMRQQISNTCRSSCLSLRNIGRIRNYLNKTSTERLVHAFITSKLDYCNSLLTNLPDVELNKLQRIQNTAARIVTLKKRHEHITPILKDLHWLPVHRRIEFKILLMTYKAIHGLAPEYIKELIVKQHRSRNLRSNSQQLLVVPRSTTATYGDRAFSVCAPKLWNDLPTDIKNSDCLLSFKSKLKTHLFKITF